MQLTYRKRTPAAEATEGYRQQPVRARGTSAAPTIQGRDGVERPVDMTAPLTMEPLPSDWKPTTEAALIALEDEHRAAQERTLALRLRLAVLTGRIEKGRAKIGAVAQFGSVPQTWRALLDALELEHAETVATFDAAAAERDALAERYVRALERYEQLCDAEAAV